MPTVTKTPAGTFRAYVRIKGYPSISKTFHTERDAQYWGRLTEDEIRRGIHRHRGLVLQTGDKVGADARPRVFACENCPLRHGVDRGHDGKRTIDE